MIVYQNETNTRPRTLIRFFSALRNEVPVVRQWNLDSFHKSLKLSLVVVVVVITSVVATSLWGERNKRLLE